MGRLPRSLPGNHGDRPAWWPPWSVPAALRTLRAVLVIPPLFALTYEGFGNLQMALFAAFGGFANLVVASFGGSRRDKLIAHFGLAVTGSIGLIIGTAVHGFDWLAPFRRRKPGLPCSSSCRRRPPSSARGCRDTR